MFSSSRTVLPSPKSIYRRRNQYLFLSKMNDGVPIVYDRINPLNLVREIWARPLQPWMACAG